MKHFKRENLTAAEKESILKTFANDSRLAYEDGYSEEWWIGENGTTPVKLLVWWEGQGDYFSFGKTIGELRKNRTFLHALFYDGDVNHSVKADNTLNEEGLDEILGWISGKTNEMPITACGGENFYTDYLE